MDISKQHHCSTEMIRTHTLLHMAKSIHSIRGASSQGISYGEPTIDLAAIQHKLDKLESHYSVVREGNVNGQTDENNPNDVKNKKSVVTTEKMATQIDEADSVTLTNNKLVWHHDEAIALPFIPNKLAIVGAGSNAIEMATIYQAFGTQVDILIPGDDVFPALDKDINKIFQRYVKRLFKIKPQAEVTAFNFTDNQVQLSVISKNKALPDALYDAVFIVADEDPQDDLFIQPFIATSFPTVTWLGWTEKQLASSELNYKVISLPWRSLGRANTDVNTNGLTKLIFNTDDHTLIGGGMIGNNADEIFGEVCLAIHLKFTAANIAHTIHAHPTLHESILLAAEVYLGTATDVLNEEEEEE